MGSNRIYNIYIYSEIKYLIIASILSEFKYYIYFPNQIY